MKGLKCWCGKDSIFFKGYEGRAYCKDCLVHQVEKNVKHTIGTNKLIEKADRIVVAVSGGKDSCFLLYILNKIFKNVKNIELFAILADEGIKGYRNKSLETAKKLCGQLGIKYHVVNYKDEFGYSVDEIVKKISHDKSKICTYCGVLKRYLLNKEARKIGATKLAVGHNLDDEAESVIMNIIRDDMNRFLKLGAYPILIKDEKFIPRIKPIRNLTEEEIVLYDKINKISFYHRKCPYSYDNVRRDVKNLINELEHKYPGTKYQIVRFYDKLKPLLIKQMKLDGKINYCKICREPTSRDVCKVCELLERLKV